MSVLNSVKIQLTINIRVPIIANLLFPYLSTNFPRMGDSKNIPNV